MEIGCNQVVGAYEYITIDSNSYEKAKTFKYLKSMLKLRILLMSVISVNFVGLLYDIG